MTVKLLLFRWMMNNCAVFIMVDSF